MIQRPARAVLLATFIAAWLGPWAVEAIESPLLLESKVYLQISPDGQDDLLALFDALEDSVAAGESQPDPVVIVLHGPEARPFLRNNYLANRTLVDRAAKLKAFNRIDMRMCETWMRNNGVSRDDLQPFVDTVPLAPDEVERLERDGYLPYREVRQPSTLL